MIHLEAGHPQCPNGDDVRRSRPRRHAVRTLGCLSLCLQWWLLPQGFTADIVPSASPPAARPTPNAVSAPPPTHWSFQPLRMPTPPALGSKSFPNPIDAFIETTRSRHGILGNPRAPRRDLIRRASLDLTGLPPTPETVAAFENDPRPDAWERCVDELLKSPRYGERWAQHWLDVVRYADTHGFEVNTERPNAWPYRDYVIRALNEDRPYDRFVRDQIAGDVLGEDAATGFLVAAAVLLPGQIGADDVSKRLARQDSLSEIVGATGQVFLGLSIGCARCHNHKFDPIPQSDYYSLQAFFAGVDYGDRPIRSDESKQRLAEAEALKPRLTQLDQALAAFEPLAQPNRPHARTNNARFNEEVFQELDARFVRFTLHDATLHPTLGLIEPCLDEVEIFTAETTPRNVALASLGTQVKASGSKTSAIHRLEHIHDGRYGNSHSWMSDEPGQGWVLFELPKSEKIRRVVWSRDREGMFEDRLPIAYTLEAGPSLDAMKTVVSVTALRPAVHPRLSADRFRLTTTQKIRFVIEASTTLEPCIDELEIFTNEAQPRNLALASHGTKVSASGTIPGSEIHQLEHIRDGIYGNSRSWISHQTGAGWVEFEFAKPETLHRVVWSRDRTGEFKDRLPTKYHIDVWDTSGKWVTVANATDRKAFSPDAKDPTKPSLSGLSAEDAKRARQLLDEKKSTEDRIAKLSAVPMVYGGTFRTPEMTKVLYRGDPEQPRDEVAPRVPAVLGSMSLPTSTPDPERRKALAEWMTSAENPLTARVAVNRIWQGHFGIGLVDTPSDFGTTGTQPSHPELLDWLASEFIRANWSIKHLHKRILTSDTYQQSSRIRPEAQAVDGDNRWLWRYTSRRLEAESIRDSMLAVSGRLNLKMGGPGFNLFKSRGGLDGFPPIESFDDNGRRRLIYAHKVRMEREIVFGAFDCPDAGLSLPRRRQSTTPIQALNLFNSHFSFDEADALAARVTAELGANASIRSKIERVYALAFARKPHPEELASLEPTIRENGLPALCRAVFNSNEFLFIP